LNAMVDHAPDMITIWDADERIIYDSPAVERHLGWQHKQRYGMRAGDLFHPDDRARMTDIKAELRSSPGKPIQSEFRIRHVDGTYHWIESTATNLCHVPAVKGFIANWRLIDNRKQAEDVRQQLMARLISAQEEERKRIAADIHDDSVQVMAAVQVRLHALARVQSEAERAEALRYLEETVRLSITRLRRLLFELRPTSLDREGLASALNAALEMMDKEMSIRYTVDSLTAAEPPLQTRVVLYRIAQEALANIRKHAQAKTVSVVISEQDGTYSVRIDDDGIGFDTATFSEPGHLGLVAMQERAEEIAGGVQIDSTIGEGTTVHIWAPLPVSEVFDLEQVGVA